MARNISVFGLYPTRESVEQGVGWLRAEGFRNTDVSVLFPENAGSKDLALRKSSKAPEGIAVGASSGGIVGGIVGWLAGIGSLAVPGAGPLIAAGPIMTILAGVGAGGTAGGILGGLVGCGMPEYEAKRYKGRVRRPGILLSVHCDNSEWANKARAVIKQTGGEDVSTASEEKADFASNVKPLPLSRPGIQNDYPPVRISNLFVREVMTGSVETLDAETLVEDALARMRRSRVTFLPVQSGTEVVGIVTDQDLSERVRTPGYDPGRTTVKSVMTTDYGYCFENQEAAEAAKILKNGRFSALLVLDHEKRLVGVLSAQDVSARAAARG
jgi:CBS domain-containing protein